MITMNEYQELALSTALYPKELGLYYTALGLTGEAGEVVVGGHHLDLDPHPFLL